MRRDVFIPLIDLTKNNAIDPDLEKSLADVELDTDFNTARP